MRRLAQILAAGLVALAALAGASIDFKDGDLRYSVANRTLRGWELVEAAHLWSPACAGGFIRSGGFPCGGATSYTFTGPGSGNILTSQTYTVTPSGSATATVTPNDSSHGGIFTPTSVTFAGADPKTFGYQPLQIGTYNLATTNGGGLTNPGAISFTTNTNQLSDGYPGLTGGSWQDNAITHTTLNAGDPFGGSNTAILTEDTTNTFHYIFHNITLTANQTYTYTVFAKRGTGTRNLELSSCESGYTACIGAIFSGADCSFLQDDSRVATETHTSLQLSSGWCVLQIVGNLGNFTSIIPAVSIISGTNGGYTGDGSSSIKAYGVTVQ